MTRMFKTLWHRPQQRAIVATQFDQFSQGLPVQAVICTWAGARAIPQVLAICVASLMGLQAAHADGIIIPIDVIDAVNPHPLPTLPDAPNTGAKIAIGTSSTASGNQSIAMGTGLTASGDQSIAIGTGHTVTGSRSGAMGDPTVITGNDSYSLGNNNQIAANNAFAVGNNIVIAAGSDNAVVVGSNGRATTNAVALGAGAVADRANTVSVGATGQERQITNVAAATQTTDAVNLAQMQASDAATLAAANTRTDTGDVATLSNANQYTDQKDASVKTLIATHKTATDQRFAAIEQDFSRFNNNVDTRFKQQDQRIDRVAAMSAAMQNMGSSVSGMRQRNRLGLGIGGQGGEQAVAVGYQRVVSDRASITVSGAFTQHETSAGVGVGFGWD